MSAGTPAASLSPLSDRDVWRRHVAAMRVVRDLDDRADRLLLLEYVLVGSEAVDAALEER